MKRLIPGSWHAAAGDMRSVVAGAFAFNAPRWAFFLDFAVFPLLIALCAWESARAGLSFVHFAGMAVAGLVLWTIAEYILHRAVFHHFPIIRDGHFAHHHAPRELIGTPTLVSAAIFAVLVYVPMVVALGAGTASALSVGLLLGYLGYVSVHYLVHHQSSHGIAYLAALKRHHALHHHGSMDCNFGVTTRIWDRVFGTLR